MGECTGICFDMFPRCLEEPPLGAMRADDTQLVQLQAVYTDYQPWKHSFTVKFSAVCRQHGRDTADPQR